MSARSFAALAPVVFGRPFQAAARSINRRAQVDRPRRELTLTLTLTRVAGLDDTAFADGENAAHRFIYASSASAGLLLLLNMWCATACSW